MGFWPVPFGGLPFGALSGDDDAPASPLSVRNLLLLSPQASDRAIITASSEVPTFPASNLQNVQPRRIFRATGTSVELSIALATVKACNALALVGGNPSDSRWVRLRGAATVPEIDSAPVVDTDWISPWPLGAKPDAPDWPSWLHVIRWDNDVALQYWQLDVSDVGNNTVDIGRLILDRAWQPSNNVDVGGTPMSHDPRDAVAETDYGFTFTDRRTLSPPRLFNLQISAANQSEVLAGLQEIQRLAGTAGDVVCCIDPGDVDNFHLLSMQGRFTKGGAFGIPPLFDAAGKCWSASIEMREFL